MKISRVTVGSGNPCQVRFTGG